MIFDIIFIESDKINNCINKDLYERKKILYNIIQEIEFKIKIENGKIFNQSFNETYKYFNTIKNQNMEGLILKTYNSKYVIGKRNMFWIKLKNDNIPYKLETIDLIILAANKSKNLSSKNILNLETFLVGCIIKLDVNNINNTIFRELCWVNSGLSKNMKKDIEYQLFNNLNKSKKYD